jgi:hypothetical protein
VAAERNPSKLVFLLGLGILRKKGVSCELDTEILFLLRKGAKKTDV